MKLAIELSKGGPYERVSYEQIRSGELVPLVGDIIIWDRDSFTVKHRLIDYDGGCIVIKAARS